MNLFSLVLVLALCIITCIGVVSAGTNSGNLVPVSSFEGGERYTAGSYNVVVLSGSYREMGRQYGSLMKEELRSVYNLIIEKANKNGLTVEDLRSSAIEACQFQPKRMKEISAGMSETSGLSVEDIQVIYYGIVFYIYGDSSCSFLAAWGDYTPDGTLIVSRNWDLSDSVSAFDPYNVLVVYNPSDGSNGVATFGPAGMRPETLMNSEGLFIADDNGVYSGSSLTMNDRPDLISEFFSFMLDYSTLKELDSAVMTTRANLAWIVNTASPEQAYSYEETVWDVKRREGEGVIAATNHFVNPTWNFAEVPATNSILRYNNLVSLAEGSKGNIDAQKMIEIRNLTIEDGGARFLHYSNISTNHQVVFVPETRELWIRILDSGWQKVDLTTLFKT